MGQGVVRFSLPPQQSCSAGASAPQGNGRASSPLRATHSHSTSDRSRLPCALQYRSACMKSTQIIGIFSRPATPKVDGSHACTAPLSHLPAVTQAVYSSAVVMFLSMQYGSTD